MKILIINYRFHFTGGPERYMFSVISELKNRGHEIIEFSVKNDKNEASKYENYFARNIDNQNEYLFEKFKKTFGFYFDFLSRQYYSLYIKNKVKKIVKDTKPDICYLLPHSGSLSVSIIDGLKDCNIPIIHRISDYNIICGQAGMYRKRVFCNDCSKTKLNLLKNKCIKDSYLYSAIKLSSSLLHDYLKIYKKVDHFITTNNFAKEQFVKFGFEDNKITTIHTFANEVSPIVKSKTNFPLKLIYMGNIDDSKGIYDLLESVKILSSEFNAETVLFDVYGGLRDYELKKVNDFIKTNKLQSLITIHGKIKSEFVSKIYKEADITLIPARWVENLPNVLVESLSYGTPVVVPRFGSFKSCLDESVAYFFEEHNLNSLVSTLKYVINNPNTINEKSKKTYNYVDKNFNKKNHINELIQIFNNHLN